MCAHHFILYFCDHVNVTFPALPSVNRVAMVVFYSHLA
jgi:hypothetical protein